MGNDASKAKLNAATLGELDSKTDFSERQIKQWHKAFLMDCPNGQLGRKQCYEVVVETFPPEKAGRVTENIFKIFDTDQSGEIDFPEFIVAVNALSSTRNSNLTKRLFSDSVDPAAAANIPTETAPPSFNNPDTKNLQGGGGSSVVSSGSAGSSGQDVEMTQRCSYKGGTNGGYVPDDKKYKFARF